MTRERCLALVVAACLLCADAAYAQVARSQFNGTVTDSAGGVLVGVTVIATNVETNVASKTTTTEAGVYVIPYLANGLYRVRVEAKGFRPAQAEQVTLRAAQTLTLDFKLEVASLAEAMTVTAPVIETSTAEIGQYVSNKEFQTWPIAVGDGQRQIQQFIFSSLPGTTGGTFEGAINGQRFRTYIEQMLAPTLAPGDIVLLDNLRSHKVAGIAEAIAARGAQLIYLPPYSPDLNPIEQAFAKYKALLRKAAERTVESLWQTIGRIADLFSPAECRNFFNSAGYAT